MCSVTSFMTQNLYHHIWLIRTMLWYLGNYGGSKIYQRAFAQIPECLHNILEVLTSFVNYIVSDTDTLLYIGWAFLLLPIASPSLTSSQEGPSHLRFMKRPRITPGQAIKPWQEVSSTEFLSSRVCAIWCCLIALELITLSKKMNTHLWKSHCIVRITLFWQWGWTRIEQGLSRILNKPTWDCVINNCSTTGISIIQPVSTCHFHL